MFFDDNSEIQTKNEHFIWVEKYRPVSMDTYLGNQEFRETIGRFLEKQEIPHILLYSNKPGTGKTTLAKIIARSLPCDFLYINASDENSVDNVRNKIKSFASTLGFNKLKILILDECLHEDTLVSIIRNDKYCKVPIKDLIQETDLVKSYNVLLDRIEWEPFVLMDKGNRETYEIEFENGETVICTENHKWFVRLNGSVVRKPLSYIIKHEIGEIFSEWKNIKTSDSPNDVGDLKVRIRSIKKSGVSKVYDINVPSNHNFFVGESEILTSNCDRISLEGQDALRNMMETFSDQTRFILTCNYVEKMREPIVSRCQAFHVHPPDKSTVAKHVAGILDAEGISYKVEDFKVLLKYYPDIRRIIQTAQQNSTSGILKITEKQVVESDAKIKLIEILKKNISEKEKLKECRQLIADNNLGDRGDFMEYYDYLYENIQEYAPKSIANTIIAIADHQYKDSVVPNKEINFASCIVTILKGL